MARDYQHEYEKYHSSVSAMKDRATFRSWTVREIEATSASRTFKGETDERHEEDDGKEGCT